MVSSLAAYPSDAAAAGAADAGRSHGNGYFNTGRHRRRRGDRRSCDRDAQVTFSKAGTYNYICLIHPDMKGSIVVG